VTFLATGCPDTTGALTTTWEIVTNSIYDAEGYQIELYLEDSAETHIPHTPTASARGGSVNLVAASTGQFDLTSTYNPDAADLSSGGYITINMNGPTGSSVVLELVSITPPGPGSGVQLSWTSGGAGATHYHVERSTDSVTFAQLAIVAVPTVTYVDTAISAGTQYWYRVRAVNSTAVSNYSNTATATAP
jgi:hypothetical protein